MATLTDEQRSFLEARRFVIIATINADGTPQQTAIWYALQGDVIVMNTAQDRTKYTNLLRDPRLSLALYDEASPYRTLTVQGTATLDDDDARAQADIARLAYRYEPAQAAQMIADHFRGRPRVSIRMTIERVYGQNL